MKLSLVFLTAVTSVLFVEQTETIGPLIWQEEFDFLDYSRWKHLITGWRGGNGEFEYYHNYSQNRQITIDYKKSQKRKSSNYFM